MAEMDVPKTKIEHQTSIPSKIELQYLKKITNQFSEDLILGRGGFGIVYKGKKENGVLIAVKKLNDMQGMDDKQFLNEIKLLMDITHPNIVRAEGYCYDMEKELMHFNGSHVLVEKVYRLLCFEYLPHGSLDKHLSDEFSGLEWHVRYNIIHGICNGLYCLHEGIPGAPILHLDLKPANVLLDMHMIPKIADFGQSRLFGEGRTHCSTMNIVGTRGYMAPEYIERGMLNKESDIYSLGVILMEILTGYRKYPENTTVREFSEVKDKWRRRLQATLNKTSLEEECGQVNLCIRIGLKCMERDPKKRPNIKEIIEILGPRSVQEDRSDVEEQSWEVVPLEWREALDIVALSSPEQSIKGLDVIFQTLLQICQTESTVPQYIIKDADRLVSYLGLLAEKTSRLILSGATSMSMAYFAGTFTINTLTQAFNIRDLAKAVKEGTLGALLRDLLIWSIVNKDGEISNSITMLLGKIQENAERISLLLVFMTLLRPLDPARWPSCATPVPLGERTHIYSELVAKCFDVEAKNLPETIGEFDLDRLLSSIQIYLEELGVEEINKRKETKDNGLVAVMDVLAQLVHIRGPLIKDHHSMVHVDPSRQTIILSYIDSFLKQGIHMFWEIIAGENFTQAQATSGIILAEKTKKYWVDQNGNNCFMLFPRGMTISLAEDPEYWIWQPMEEESDVGDDAGIEVAGLKGVYWLDIVKKQELSHLTPGVTYEVVFEAKLKRESYGWDVPVDLCLMFPDGRVQKRKESLGGRSSEEWLQLRAGYVEAREGLVGELVVSLTQHGGHCKNGLVVKGIRITPRCPKNDSDFLAEIMLRKITTRLTPQSGKQLARRIYP